VRETIRQIGYVDADLGFSADSCAVLNAIDKQSPDIAQGVDQAYEARTDASDDDELDVAGAGDQGMMFGYATNRRRRLMPLPISLAHAWPSAWRRCARRRRSLPAPGRQTQVSVRYRDGRPVEIEKLLISTQHKEGASRSSRTTLGARGRAGAAKASTTRRSCAELPRQPDRAASSSRTRRRRRPDRPQIIVDTYGAWAAHGGGAFSGQGPVEGRPLRRLRARYVAKNVVAGLDWPIAARCRSPTPSAGAPRSA